MRTGPPRRTGVVAIITVVMTVLSGCGVLRDWQGANTFPLPGTKGSDDGSFVIRAEMPDIQNLQRNSRVRVNDVTIGTVTDIDLQGWHALVTMRLDPGTDLPANATAKLGQTSLLGSVHVELAPPGDAPPVGKLKDGSLIPLSSSSAYPSTEKTLSAVSLLLNGGGIGQLQDITAALSTAFSGREEDVRHLIGELDKFVSYLNDQKDDIIAATESLNNLVKQFADQKPILDRALQTIPRAVTVLKDERQNLIDAVDRVGKFGALAADSVNQTKENLVKELRDIGPVLQSLADAGPALTKSLDYFATFPWPKSTLANWMRGEYGNLSAIFDLTLSRLDAGLLTGTRFEGELTELELQWGRTIGQMPSPYTARNPLVAPYQFNQGP
jgi:phospholipid/cholesterol/gamma-HCH transport system substrate-binding protein